MMLKERFAILDLGTNTFHLLVIEVDAGEFVTLHKEKLSVKIGEGGINRKHITAVAAERAMKALHYFKSLMDQHQVSKMVAIATSAFRNAENGQAFADTIFQETGIPIRIISGDDEAAYIYHGVKMAVNIGTAPALIMDIGGGSVEFIIGNQERIFWKRSFEIGGQRLYEKFHTQDPIHPEAVSALYNYIDTELEELDEAMALHKPEILIGSSGSFDTLSEIHFRKFDGLFDIEKRKESDLPIDAFTEIFADLLIKDHAQRLLIPGMIELRAEMIVVACCIIDHVLKSFRLDQIKVSTYSLKEGFMAELLA